jgi:acetoin utilization deacetylase AcuC-like enzyme
MGHTFLPLEFRVSPLSRVEELSTTHSPVYVARFLNGDLTKEEIRNVGFPWSKSGVDRALSSVGGTVQAACDVCDELLVRRAGSNISRDEEVPPVWAAHVAGGTHHAFYEYGEGFCVFSDIAVAANVVLKRYPSVVKRILIIDLDVHQGNGNAVLFQGRDDVRTFSMHCSGNFFSERQTSDLDVELPMGCTDETYLATLYHWINQMRKNDDIAKGVDLIFFQAGVDILHDDRLGRMSITSNGVERRNKLVFDFAHSLQIPMVITMGGGYPRTNNWDPILEAHANVYFQAHQYLSNLSEINISSKEDRSELISDKK